jgi:hypothetical protein
MCAFGDLLILDVELPLTELAFLGTPVATLVAGVLLLRSGGTFERAAGAIALLVTAMYVLTLVLWLTEIGSEPEHEHKQYASGFEFAFYVGLVTALLAIVWGTAAIVRRRAGPLE